jgi:hypothetical protein
VIRPDAIGHQQAVRLVELFRRFPVQDLTSGMAALDARQRFRLSYRDVAIIEASPARRAARRSCPKTSAAAVAQAGPAALFAGDVVLEVAVGQVVRGGGPSGRAGWRRVAAGPEQGLRDDRGPVVDG